KAYNFRDLYKSMQTFFRLLSAIFLGHALADFVLQPARMVKGKEAGKLSQYLGHGAVHYICAAGFTGFFVPGSILSARTHLAIIGLVLVHLLIDFAKIRLAKLGLMPNGATAFAADQLLHLLTIGLAACVLTPGIRFGAITQLLQSARAARSGVIAVPAVYIAVVFGGGYFIRFLTRSLAEDIRSHSPEKSSEQLLNAGLYLGWLERFLVLSALLLQSPAMVGLILTAKSIAR